MKFIYFNIKNHKYNTMKYLDYKNQNQVKDYLIYKLSNNKLYKGSNFYKTIAKLYSIYPSSILKIIDKLYELTYFKDYLRVLYYSKNNELNDYIYTLLLNQIKQDMENYNNNKPISTLAKWLPRKGREFDRKLDFVNIFSEMLFGKLNKVKLYTKYRRMIVDLTKKINPIELDLCSNKLQNIQVDEITKKNYYTYNSKLNRHEELKNQLYDIKDLSIMNMDYNEFISRVLWLYNQNEYKRKLYEYEIKYFENIWENDFEKYYKNISIDIKNKYLILDLNSSMFNTMKKDIIKISLIFLRENNNIIINKKNPIVIQKKSIFDSLDDIFNNLGINFNTDIDKIQQIINNENLPNKKFVLITEKPYKNIKSNEQYIYIQYNNNLFKETAKDQYEGNFLLNKYTNKKKILLENLLNNSEFNSSLGIILMKFMLVMIFLMTFGINYIKI